MKAIAVYPGKPYSMHLEEVPVPGIADVPGGRGVLVKVLRVGVDGTDKEINAAEFCSQISLPWGSIETRLFL
jgi:glucose 1-dehydrogenase